METPVGPPGILVANRFDRGADYAVQRRAGTHDWLLTYTLAGLGRFRSGASPNHPGARLQGHVLFHPPAGTA